MKKGTLKFKGLSLFVVLTMLTSMLQLSAFATWADNKWTDTYAGEWDLNNTKGNFTGSITTDQLPTIETVVVTPTDEGYTEGGKSNLEAGDEVYIALKAKNFSSFAKNNSGAVQIATSLVFDKRYLTPLYESFDWEDNALQLVKNSPTSFVSTNVDMNGATIKGRYQLDADPTSTDAAFDDSEDSPLSADQSNLQKMTAVFKYRAKSSTDSTELASVINEGTYLAIYPFTVNNNIPSDASLGVALSRSGNISVALQNGSGGFNKAYGASDGLHNYLKLVDNVKLFPANYTVEFYGNYDTDSGVYSNQLVGKNLTIQENSSISSTEGASLPADSEFTAYTPEGKFYNGLKYIDTNGDPQKFTADTVLDETLMGTNTTLKVYADYAEGHTVTFNSNYPTEVTTPTATTKPVTVSPKVGSTIPEASKPTVGKATDDPAPDFVTPDGYSFVGWFDTDAATGGNEITFGDSGTVVVRDGSTIDNVYARWAQTVTYTFDFNYTGAPTATTVTKNSGEALGTDAPTDPTRATYDFVGWDTKSNGSGTRYNAANPIANLNASEDTTLYAIWEPKSDQDTFTLTFDAAGGTLKNPTSITVVQGDPITAAMMPDDPEKTAGTSETAYVFEGWFKDASPSNTDEITAPITLTEDTTAYAHWSYDENNPDAVTITFNDQGADKTPVSPTTITIASGDQIGALPTDPEKTGHSFSGWFPNADGTGDKVTTETTFSSSTTVYAKWTADITVVFDVNTGTGTPQNQSGKPTDNLKLPADGTVTKTDYKLIGWNTEKNGSGVYVKETMSLNDVYTITDADIDATTSTVTVYAQWADATITDPDPNPPVPPTPDEGGVLVKFDTNASGSADKTGIVDAKPNWKIPKYGDAIGADQMPTDPIRPNYKLKAKKWNTKPDGSGIDVDGTTPIGANLGDAITMTAPNKYEVTVYAQWEVDDDQIDDPNDKITVKFNKNTDGKGTDAAERTETVFRGDSLGYVPELPTNSANIKASGWFEGTKNATSGMIEFGETTPAFTATTAINPAGNATEITYYSKYEMYLLVEIQEVESVYDGTEKDPKYKVWQIEKPVDGDENIKTIGTTPIFGGDDGLPFSDASSQFVANYTTSTNTTGATLQNADKYTINSVTLKDGATLASQGATIALIRPKEYTIKPKPIAVTLDPDKQKAKKETPVQLIGIDDLTIPSDALISGDTKENVLKVTYKSWEDAGDQDGKIQTGELTEITNITEIDKYVMEIGTKNTNYAISSVDSSVEGKNVVVYTQTEYPDAYNTTGEAAGTIKTPGTNLVFEVVPNDPSMSGIVVNSVNKTVVSTDPLGLKQSDYTTDQSFDSAETPTVKDYYVRITDTEADHVQFIVTLTNEETTTLTASDGATPEGATYTQNPDKTWTVTAPLTKKGKDPNVITIVTKAGNADDAPSITYTFNVQQLVKPKIKLNYGNSPYGEIMRDSNITDKDAAKSAFSNEHHFTTNCIPTGRLLKEDFFYDVRAWNGGDNLDEDDTALFTFTYKDFVDPGITIKDSLGNTVDPEKITRSIQVSTLESSDMNSAVTQQTEYSVNCKAENDTFAYATLAGDKDAIVKPGVYTMKYSFPDEATGTTINSETDSELIDGKITRNVVILPMMGDTTIDNMVKANDSLPINVQAVSVYGGLNASDLVSYNLMLYRVYDVTGDGVVKANDSMPVNVMAVSGYGEAGGYPVYYKEFTK